MKSTHCTLLALSGLLLVPPFAFGDSRRSGGRSTVTITYTYRVYGG